MSPILPIPPPGFSTSRGSIGKKTGPEASTGFKRHFTEGTTLSVSAEEWVSALPGPSSANRKCKSAPNAVGVRAVGIS